MTSSIPPHYSSHYVQQRYNKALQIVQNLSVSSFQPTKEQRLQLYAFYKQVSIGNVNTSRPGLFDMVGRAKWDAWKKLEGTSKLEAQHQYVETLLLAVSEAYQKPASKAQAQQIIQAFATMRHVDGDGDTTDDELTTTTTEDDNNGDEESSEASVDEEEKAYLLDIQQNAGRSTPTTSFRQTEPTPPPRRNDRQQQRTFLRPKSSASLDRNPVSLRPFTRDSPLTIQHFDDNPWAAAASEDHPQHQHSQHQYRTDSRSTNHTNVSSVQMLPSPVMGGRLRTLQSPFHGSSAASSVTATLSNVRSQQQRRIPDPPVSSQDYAYASIVSLGPATKRALESLQAEVIALNERIDDLRHELLRRDRSTTALPPPATDDDEWEGWRWVIKAAVKYAAVNFLTAFILLVVLYKRGSPAAYAVVGKLSKLFYKVRRQLRVTTVVV